MNAVYLNQKLFGIVSAVYLELWTQFIWSWNCERRLFGIVNAVYLGLWAQFIWYCKCSLFGIVNTVYLGLLGLFESGIVNAVEAFGK